MQIFGSNARLYIKWGVLYKGSWKLFLSFLFCIFVFSYVESDRDWEHAPQSDWGSPGSVQPQWTWSQQALGVWRRGMFLFPSTCVWKEMLCFSHHWLTELFVSCQIKRPYFHVKALEKTQLNNWKEYLDFEIENGTPERVVVLFERCLIACALYEEFWIKVAWSRTSRRIAAASLHFPINDFTSTVKRPSLSLRVTLICDCICCIRGWPACHTRFDCSICQLLRCIFFVSHYLTETYLIGSMKVLMGLHRKFLRTILSMKQFTVCIR